MKPRDWFIIGLRLLGVYQLIYAVEYFATLVCFMAGFYRSSTGSVPWYLILVGVHFMIGLFLLVIAPLAAACFIQIRRVQSCPKIGDL